jgi:hypothetical protein
MFRRLKMSGALMAAQIALAAVPAAAQSGLSGDTIKMARAAGPITVDGDLSDEGWRGATRVEKWYEVNPGDNLEPKLRNVGYLTYDDWFFYAGVEFEDPAPEAMRATYADRDNIGNGFNDYGGVIVDAGDTGNTAAFFVVSPRTIQYDARSPTMRRARTRRRTSSGNRRRRSACAAGRSRSGSPSRRCATRTSTRRRGASCCTATIRGTFITSSSPDWQSVMFIGYGDDCELSEGERLEPLDRQFFVKLSYALQR